jgi:hypothetical protein
VAENDKKHGYVFVSQHSRKATVMSGSVGKSQHPQAGTMPDHRAEKSTKVKDVFKT